MLFDTHAHIDDEAFDADREELIKRISASDVSTFVNVAYSLESAKRSVALANEHDFIYAAVGIHPHEAATIQEDQMDVLRELSKDKKVVAIGEIGLDYYYNLAPKEVQKFWFKRQIQLAEELQLPYIVHSRDASMDTLDVIKENTKNTGFVLHCYSQSAEMVKNYVNLGGYISFAGPITFKNASNLREALKVVPLDKLLVETDSPYLTPVPKRGKRNDPTNVELVAGACAEILNVTYEELCQITTTNAKTFFGIQNQQ